MSNNYVGLRKFTADEIIFDDDDVIAILLFFFPGYDKALKDYAMNHPMREFAQGLLLEAVDASYAMGYVQIIYDIFYMKPNINVGKALKKFGKKAVKHWFKHLKNVKDLQDIKIYDTVKNQIRINFISEFQMRLSGVIAKANRPGAAFVNYTALKTIKNQKVWC